MGIAHMIATWDGFDFNAQDASGCTALGYAKINGNTKLVKLLQDLGCSSSVDEDNKLKMMEKALGYAKIYNHTELAKLLQKIGFSSSLEKDDKKSGGKTSLNS